MTFIVVSYNKCFTYYVWNLYPIKQLNQGLHFNNYFYYKLIVVECRTFEAINLELKSATLIGVTQHKWCFI